MEGVRVPSLPLPLDAENLTEGAFLIILYLLSLAMNPGAAIVNCMLME